MKYNKFLITIKVNIVILLVLFYYGCSDSIVDSEEDNNIKLTSNIDNNKFKILNKEYIIPNGKLKWQAQLDKVIESNDLLKEKNIKLLSYKKIKYINERNDLEIVKKDIINSKVSIPDNCQSKFFKSYNSKINCKLKLESIFHSNNTTKMQCLKADSNNENYYIFKSNDVSAVEICWEINNEKKRTICLVSDEKGILFDRILSLTLFSFRNKKITKSNLSNSSLKVKPYYQHENLHSFYYNSHYHELNIVGEVAIGYDVRVYVTALVTTLPTGELVGVLKDTESACHAWSITEMGFSAKAKVKKVSISKETKQPTVTFAFGVALSDNHNNEANVTWNNASERYSVNGILYEENEKFTIDIFLLEHDPYNNSYINFYHNRYPDYNWNS